MVDDWLRIRKNVSKSEPDSPLEGTITNSEPPEIQYIDGHRYVHVAGCDCRGKMENLNPSCIWDDDLDDEPYCLTHTKEYHAE